MTATSCRPRAPWPSARTLNEIARLFESVDDAEARLRRALELLGRVVPYDRCALLEAPPGLECRFLVAPELMAEAIDARELTSHEVERATLRAALRDVLELLSEPHERPNLRKPRTTRALSKTWRTHLAVPLVGLDQVMGILFVGRARNPYKERDLCLLAVITAQIAAYLTALQLRDEELERTRELDEARQAAEAANRAKDEFVAMISHELRTPLNAILGWTQLLRSPIGTTNTDRALETIERNAKAQSRLVEDLLDVSRIRLGKLRIVRKLIHLAPVIEAAVEATRPQAEHKSIRLDCALAPSAGPVLGDAERLQQVISNLLTNAVKFTPSGGAIEVRAERAAAQVRIQVIDTGRGISPEMLPKVFLQFHQADLTTRREHDGLGLGLPLVSHLVGLHGGQVRAESPGHGKGATFTVELPLAEETEPDAHDSSAREAGDARELEGARVLVVDDNEDILEVVRAVLEHHGADVTVATSAAEALAAIERSRPDVLLSDIGMPGDNGYTLMKKVAALEAHRGTWLPAAALTARTTDEDRDQALEAGFLVHLSKPIEPERLVAATAWLAGMRGAAAGA